MPLRTRWWLLRHQGRCAGHDQGRLGLCAGNRSPHRGSGFHRGCPLDMVHGSPGCELLQRRSGQSWRGDLLPSRDDHGPLAGIDNSRLGGSFHLPRPWVQGDQVPGVRLAGPTPYPVPHLAGHEATGVEGALDGGVPERADHSVSEAQRLQSTSLPIRPSSECSLLGRSRSRTLVSQLRLRRACVELDTR
jgi:hypothetical protein